MPANRLPTNILEARGAFKVNPERKDARKHEPKPNKPMGDPPSSLEADQKRVWREIAKNLPNGVAYNSDRITMEIGVRLVAKMRADGLNSGELSQLQRFLASMGMTPADRSRVQVEPAGKSDAWDDM